METKQIKMIQGRNCGYVFVDTEDWTKDKTKIERIFEFMMVQEKAYTYMHTFIEYLAYNGIRLTDYKFMAINAESDLTLDQGGYI